jgi:hypothetical protein
MAAKMTLDFSQVKDVSGFSPKHKEEGEYLGTITSFEDTKSKSGNAMWVFGVQLKTDRRAVYPVYCLLAPEQVWKLRNLMLAAGFKVPKKRISVDGNRLVGKDIGIFLEDDEYEGKMKSVITSFFTKDEYSGPVTDDDSDDDLPEEDDEVEEEYEDGDEETDAADGSTDDEGDEASEDETDEDSDEDEADEEPEPAPVKTKKAKAKKAPEPEDEDDDEMDVDEL